MKSELKEFFTEDTPVYIQLYQRLRHEIATGIYPYGTRFLSKRVIADRYGLSLVTVEHSLALLIEEGYIEPRERSGAFVTYREEDLFSAEAVQREEATKREEALQRSENATGNSGITIDTGDNALRSASGQAGGSSLSEGPRPSVSVTAGIPAFPFPSYARVMRSVITEYGEKLLDRMPHGGVPILRQAIADYLARSRGIRVLPEQIYIGAGSEYFYGLLVQLFGKQKIFAIENPSYEKIERVYRANEAGLELLPLGSDGIPTASLRESRADVLHITPYRSFPSGISTSAAKRREYVRWAEMHDRYIVEDDFESEFTPSRKPEETVFSLSDGGRVLYLNSFTKTISPATRISYLVLPPKLVPVFEERLGFYACTVPAFDQYVLAEFIRNGDFERHINRVRRKKRGSSAGCRFSQAPPASAPY